MTAEPEKRKDLKTIEPANNHKAKHNAPDGLTKASGGENASLHDAICSDKACDDVHRGPKC